MEYKTTNYKWIILIFSIVGYIMVILHRMSPTVMADSLMQDLGVNAAFMGVLASAYFYPYAFMQIPSGLLSDKYSPKKIIVFAFTCSAIGTFIFSVATNPTLVFLGRALVGIGCALILMPAYKALSNWFDKKSYLVIVSSVLAVAFGVGSLLAGFPLSYFIESLGWRSSMQFFSYFIAIVALLAFLLFRDSPKSPVYVSTQETLEKLSVTQCLKTTISKYNFWILTLGFFVNGAVFFSFSGLWAGLYYTDVIGLSTIQMSSLLSIAAGITIITPIIFASIAAKTASRKKVFIVANAGLVIAILYLFLRNGAFTKIEVYAWTIFLYIVLTAPAGLYMASARELFADNVASTANGFLYSLSMIGSAIYQPLVGFLIDNSGYTSLLTAKMFDSICWLYLVTALVGLISTFFLKEKENVLI